jgi:hypothetical protein
MSVDKTIILLEASHSNYDVGDNVPKGATLGFFKGKAIVARFDSTIQSISFDSEEHLLTVVLVETRQFS